MCRHLLIMVFLFLLAPACGFSRPDINEIRGAVKTLGIDDSDYVYRKLEILETNPDSAARFLIEELKPIRGVEAYAPEQYVKHKKDAHVIWCIRALRYLFGVDFAGHTKHVFTPRESIRVQMTQVDSGKFSFFGVRMSHDIVYIAPVDVQQEIIREWRDWYENNRQKIKLNRVWEFDDWYF